MQRVSTIFGTPWFHRRFTLTPEGRYVTVTELAEWARGPYDHVRKNLLLYSGTTQPPRVVLLAPARHGDGTTTTAVLLAASLASGHRCLLIDLNFRRPALAATLGLNGARGLATVLRNVNGNGTLDAGMGAELSRAIVPTPVPNLFALPNVVDATDRALPAMTGVAAVIRHSRDQFDYVVIDAAPVLDYPDTPLIGGLADVALLVVAADSTPRKAALEARSEIERGKARVLGVILTRQRRFVPEALERRLKLGDQ
jgi:Mrp family chromosome partitioning ATPase